MDGFIILDKSVGPSSARAVGKVKRLLPRGVKIGHAGTLDPFASGVLLLLVGRGTKWCERLMDQPKVYEATLKLGATTETDDPETPEIPWPGGAAPVTREAVENALRNFVGEIQQRPPAFSAMKVGGRRAYQLARSGKPVVLEPRTVRVYAINLLQYDWPVLQLRVNCGRGTYIRSLARDLGEALNTGAHLTALRRTAIGPHTIAAGATLDQILIDGVDRHLVPLPTP